MKKIKLLALMAVCASALMPTYANAQANPYPKGSQPWCDYREAWCLTNQAICYTVCDVGPSSEKPACLTACNSAYDICMGPWYDYGCEFYN